MAEQHTAARGWTAALADWALTAAALVMNLALGTDWFLAALAVIPTAAIDRAVNRSGRPLPLRLGLKAAALIMIGLALRRLSLGYACLLVISGIAAFCTWPGSTPLWRRLIFALAGAALPLAATLYLCRFTGRLALDIPGLLCLYGFYAATAFSLTGTRRFALYAVYVGGNTLAPLLLAAQRGDASELMAWDGLTPLFFIMIALALYSITVLLTHARPQALDASESVKTENP